MKILIIGLGSIGRRHATILESVSSVEIAVLRSRKGTLSEKSNYHELYTVEDAIKWNPAGVIVCTPTANHAKDALPFLKLGCKVLIEKPIVEATSTASKLVPYKIQIRVAYCFRFLEILNRLYEYWKEDPVFKVGFKRSYYLPKWHPYADYRNEYAARKDQGGGVIRTLSHEIDLALFWFGDYESVHGIVDKLSFLELDVDDFAFFSIKMKNGVRISYELDYYSPIHINEGNAYSNNGAYKWDINTISYCSYSSDKWDILYTSDKSGFDQMYVEQMNDFLNFVQIGDSVNSNFDQAFTSLKIIESIDGTR